jgi:hypothetical protein
MKSNLKQFVLFFGILSIYACASEPVPFNLPLDHPANPQAPETIFTHPVNPFQEGVSSVAPQSNPESKMIHEAHEASEENQRDLHMHQMQMKQESKQMPSSANDKDGNKHKEKH